MRKVGKKEDKEYINPKKERKRQERDEDRSNGAQRQKKRKELTKNEKKNDKGETTRMYGRSSISIFSSTC